MNGSGSVFKGAIGGGTIRAKFFSDHMNEDADLLVISYAPLSGAPSQVDTDATPAGGHAEVEVDALENGILEVWLAIGAAEDSGRLQVQRDGLVLDDEMIRGSVRWVYSVEARDDDA